MRGDGMEEDYRLSFEIESERVGECLVGQCLGSSGSSVPVEFGYRRVLPGFTGELLLPDNLGTPRPPIGIPLDLVWPCTCF